MNSDQKLGQISRIAAMSFLMTVFGVCGVAAAAGDLDPSFGNGGIVIRPIMEIGHYRAPTAILVQPDGKILVAGQIDEYADLVSFFIARFDPSGSPDPSFGDQGMIFPPIEYGSACVGASIALQTDGKIVAVGVHGNDLAVHRYNSDGTPDSLFGDGGSIVFTPSGEDSAVATDVALRPDGKIVVVGYAWGFGRDTVGMIARFNPDGSLDEDFGAAGVTTTTLGGWTLIHKVFIQQDGKLLAFGEHESNPNTSSRDIAIMRFAADGSVDTSFGTSGSIVASYGQMDFYSGGGLQPDGKLVVASWGYDPPMYSNTYRKMVRYTASGSVDTTFFADDVNVSWSAHRISNFIFQPNGKIVAFGSGGSPVVPNFGGISVVRLHPNGSIDTSFGSNGGTVTPIASGDYKAFAGALQADGKILILGSRIHNYDVYEFAIARYQGDPTFSVSGRVTTPGGQGLRNASVLLVDAAGMQRRVTTSSFGFYTFDQVRRGESYTVGVISKRYRFTPRSVQVDGNLSNVDHVGLE